MELVAQVALVSHGAAGLAMLGSAIRTGSGMISVALVSHGMAGWVMLGSVTCTGSGMELAALVSHGAAGLAMLGSMTCAGSGMMSVALVLHFERLVARPLRVRFDFSGGAVAFCAAVSFATFAASR